MNQDFWNSIILITSSNTDFSGNFGTGFVIHQDERTTYVLTCAHVVSTVGGPDHVNVSGHPGEVKVLGDASGCDLAVLSVEDALIELQPLKLGVFGIYGTEFVTAGFYSDATKTFKLAELKGKLGGVQIIGHREGDRTPAWNLEIIDNSKQKLKTGYSGSPVVDKESGYVLSVIAQKLDERNGLAISIEALSKIWQEMPQNLISRSTQILSLKSGENNSEYSFSTNNIDTDLYLERRDIEHRCYRAILQPGCLIRIKAPWYMGKTLLMNKIFQQAKKHGYLTVYLNFRSADKEHFVNLDKFLRWFCACVSKQLNELGLQVSLPNSFEDYWDNTFGSKVSCKDYFQKNLLEQISENSILVLGLDDVDQLDKNREIANEFFDILRDWCEEANRLKLWRKLRLVLAYSRKIHISDIYRSPFNVGLPIELREFEPDEVQLLAKQNRLNWDKNQVQLLMEMVGGYPYLVQRAFEYISHQYISLEDFLATALTNTGIYSEHLQNHLLILQKHPELKEALKKLLNPPNPIYLELTHALELESMGIVKLDGNNAEPRCNLYRKYFQKYL